jgi:hypothetical protein
LESGVGQVIRFRGHSGEWRNGRRAGFRCQCPSGRGGSSPPSPTAVFAQFRTVSVAVCNKIATDAIQMWRSPSNHGQSARTAAILDLFLLARRSRARFYAELIRIEAAEFDLEPSGINSEVISDEFSLFVSRKVFFVHAPRESCARLANSKGSCDLRIGDITVQAATRSLEEIGRFSLLRDQVVGP